MCHVTTALGFTGMLKVSLETSFVNRWNSKLKLHFPKRDSVKFLSMMLKFPNLNFKGSSESLLYFRLKLQI